MTDEELIKALRDADAYNRKHYVRDPLHTDAADRIEQLVAEVKEWHSESLAWIEKWGLAVKDRNTAEAKLAKAVEALRYMTHPKLDESGKLLVWMNEKEMRKAAKAVLAELEKTE
jgi:thiamine pyrophosphate-dependent acetolactate synthase large subunit-like protein